ncbi:SusC/RagA family TonB-linked outer membrane protein [Chitinophaga ginsengisoli]|uniref:TonB-linked SusC/RagA family outer membrane protein n=1 Tax=Chitinophaga ginsengisoli TaxID=363837 RepID=A0A2P8G9Q5_9BACT|nr:SusC/RagA family TonB-linked outer membrane protein [Chitinophaga ginsengisoli]PSL30702.1 TonB-linked SusC/RagA family outer membrane protein [Chitinophaga ginsengisoli]
MPRTVHVKRRLLYAFCVAFLCLCVNFQPAARANAEPLQGKQISISVRKSSLANILNQVSKKSGITIYFVDTDLAPYTNIDYDAKDKDVINILAELFRGKDLLYEVISEKQIGVRKSNKKESPSFSERDTLVTISGTVTNEKGEPIPGVTVKVKNRNFGTTTNEHGKFEIENAQISTILIFTNVAYLTQEIPIRGKTNLGTIRMQEYVGNLDETIVIAYGTTTRRLNPGDVSRVTAEQIEKQPIDNPLLALQGRVPGLVVTQTNGMPGSAVKVQLRGQNSLNRVNGGIADTEPLYVIDGLPYSNNISGIGGGAMGLSQVSAISFLNPADIESVEVLKDADATAIYGSRAANGVILITTKKGKPGAAKFNVDYSSGIGGITKKLKLLNTEQYLGMRKEAFLNDGVSLPTTPSPYTNHDLLVWDKNKYTDWQEVLIGGTAHYNNLKASVTGGAANSTYLLSGGYSKQTVVLPGDQNDQKGNVHISVTAKSNDDKFRTTVSASFLHNKTNLIDYDFASNIFLAPNAPDIYNADGSINWAPNPINGNPTWYNPFASLLSKYSSTFNNLISNIDLNINILKNISFKTVFGYNMLDGKAFSPMPLMSISPAYRANSTASSNFYNNSIRSLSIEPQLNYSSRFGRSELNILIGGSYQSNSMYNQTVFASGFKSDDLLESLSAASSFFAINTSSQYKYTALFFRGSYVLDNKYIINLNARRDGSSRFGPGNQFGNFGSAAAAWIFSSENFFKNIRERVNFGKLRISYGITGNENIGDYKYLELFGSTGVGVPYQGSRGLISSGVSNPYYAWETTRKLEVGLELGFLKNRFFLTTSYYRNRSANQLLAYALPEMSGPGTLIANSPALIQNKGIEVIVSAKWRSTTNFEWETGLNISVNRDKLLSYPNLSESPYALDYSVGQSFSGVKVYSFDKVDAKTGTYRFFSRDGESVESPNYFTDRIAYRNTSPKFFGGLSNSLSFKGVSLDFLVQFVKQDGIKFSHKSVPGTFLGGINNQPISVLERWRNSGDNTAVAKFSQRFDQSESYFFIDESNYNVTDASFIRLKNLSLSYTLPSRIIHWANVASARVYVRGQNLLTLTSYKSGDPETGNVGTLPPLKILTCGVALNF